MIPKVIHYCWFGGNPIPDDLKKCIESWKKFCPDYEIEKWDESNFDIHCHPFVESAYNAKAWAFVSDYARLKIVYDNGGIYLDTDVELLKNLDFLLNNACYIGIQQPELLCNTGLGFGAEKLSPVVCKMLQKYDGIIFGEQEKTKIACPWLNNEVIKSIGFVDTNKITYLRGVTVYPPQYFDPLSTGNTENLLCADSVSVHHYAASWTSGKVRIKRKLIRLFGEERYYQIKKFFHRAK